MITSRKVEPADERRSIVLAFLREYGDWITGKELSLRFKALKPKWSQGDGYWATQGLVRSGLAEKRSTGKVGNFGHMLPEYRAKTAVELWNEAHPDEEPFDSEGVRHVVAKS